MLILDGENSINSVATGTSISPVVQLLDGLEQPIAGADVTFEAPASGAGGTFSGGKRTITERTDYHGQATATFRPNSTPGSFEIKVTAVVAGRSTQTVIHQENDSNSQTAMTLQPPRPWYKSWKWWAVIGAGAGGGVAAILLLKGSNNPTITLGPGTPVIGGAR